MQAYVSLIIMIATCVLALSIIKSKMKLQEHEKNSNFECGFNPLSKLRNSFSLLFFLLTIVFSIFDAEIALLIPCSMGALKIQPNYWLIMVNFILILILMGLYEWYDGSLDWK